jgi:hypothetical protein
MDLLLPSSFAPAKRKRQARTDDNVTSLEKYLSNVVMRKEPSSRRARPAAFNDQRSTQVASHLRGGKLNHPKIRQLVQ